MQPPRALLVMLFVALGCSSGSTSDDVDGGGNDAAPSQCNALANAAPVVAIVYAAGSAPAPQGGTISDGTYYLTSLAVYAGPDGGTGPDGETVTETIQISGATVQSVLESAIGAGTRTDTIAVSGVDIDDTQTCPGPSESQFTFTATGTSLVFFTVDGQGFTEVDTFTRQ